MKFLNRVAHGFGLIVAMLVGLAILFALLSMGILFVKRLITDLNVFDVGLAVFILILLSYLIGKYTE